MTRLQTILTIFRKEIRDALRDRRTLLTVLVSSVLMGPLVLLSFMAAISINLGFINLLPIPVLDGGHLAFYAAEAIRRKPASARSQEWAFRTGVAFVVALMLFVTLNDLTSLNVFGKVSGG